MDYLHGEYGVSLAFTFDAEELGGLPQVVGFVISNDDPVTATFYGREGEMIDTIRAPAVISQTSPVFEPFSQVPLSLSHRLEDSRFLGVSGDAGISRVTISSPARFSWLDDFQYGQLTPEPAGWLLTAFGVLAWNSFRARSRAS